MKLKKIFLLFILTQLLTNCGFSPLYKDFNNAGFTINILDVSGDRMVNNLIKNKFKNTNQDTNKIYNVVVDSDFTKNIIAKDTTGAATEYKIIIQIKFTITSENLNKEIFYKENFNMKKINDKLEEEEYEKSIKTSLTNIILRKLILQLSKEQ